MLELVVRLWITFLTHELFRVQRCQTIEESLDPIQDIFRHIEAEDRSCPAPAAPRDREVASTGQVIATRTTDDEKVLLRKSVPKLFFILQDEYLVSEKLNIILGTDSKMKNPTRFC